MSELLDRITDDFNIAQALRKVCANGGAGGVDKVTVDELEGYMKAHWEEIRNQIRSRQYNPQPVLRVEIPKPNGGVRKLGIPTVIDRVIEQAIVQVLTPIFDPMFSEYSYGFRPGRCCQQAITKLKEYINDGYGWIVDIDLEKFFDNVPQDRLMSYVGRVIRDGDTESLICKYLKAGVMNKGVYEQTPLGTPQGGNLSPLLSNIMLHELDKELESRDLRFTRYADDCIIVVKSQASAKRVMQSIARWIERKLGLKVNATKSQITRPGKLKYLGYGFNYNSKDKAWVARPHQDSVAKFERTLKKLCKRNWSIDLTTRFEKINSVIRGWINYFILGSMKTILKQIDEHLRTMVRVIIWKQWKVPSKRRMGLIKLGIDKDMAKQTSYCGDRYYWIARKTCLVWAVSQEILKKRGLESCLQYYYYQRAKRECSPIYR
jgi:group II intron reverse transcriptase/maturase